MILSVCGTISACQLSPPNVEVCVGLREGAFCQYTLEDKERFISDIEWDAMQLGRFSMDADAFGEYQKFVETACEHKKCTKREKDLQKKLIKHMGRINEVL